MARRHASRWLAPLAIVAVGLAAYGIFESGDGTEGAASGAKPSPASQRSTTGPGTGSTTESTPTRRTYVVRSGDTLSSIALDADLSVARLQELNPDIDVQALQPGQRLKLRR